MKKVKRTNAGLRRLGVDIPPDVMKALQHHCITVDSKLRDVVSNWLAEKLNMPIPYPPEPDKQ